jgi:ribosome-binding factor A
MPFRAEQIAEQIRRELAEVIRLRVSDPRIAPITITRVKVSDDLGFARILFAELSVDAGTEGQTLKGLVHATGFLRSELGKRLDLRHVPELRFQVDHSIEEGIQMTTLIEKVREDDERRSQHGTAPSDES